MPGSAAHLKKPYPQQTPARDTSDQTAASKATDNLYINDQELPSATQTLPTILPRVVSSPHVPEPYLDPQMLNIPPPKQSPPVRRPRTIKVTQSLPPSGQCT